MSKLINNSTRLRGLLDMLQGKSIPGGVSTSSFGNKVYSFGVLSDIHLRWGAGGPGTSNYNFRNGIDDFNRAIPALKNLGVDFVCIAGDVGYDSKVEELQLYKTAIDAYPDIEFYATTGNHDWSHTDAIWEQYVGHPRNHEFVHDGDVFLFMGVNQSSSSAELANPYGSHLTWLKERFARYQGARIFVFMHYPITGYAGLRDGTYYGFSAASTEDDELLNAALATKNVVIFGGHTHYKFDCEATYDTINVFNFNHKKVSLVHVPSSAYPRNASHSEEPDLSEGYVVEVYEKGIIMRGVDLVTGEYMPAYEYALTTDNNPAVVDTASIVLSTNDISLGSEDSVEIGISLTNPINTTVQISADNNRVSVSPTSLQFTEANYATSQTITVSTGILEESGSSLITVSADGLTSKTISVSLSYEASAIPVPAGATIPVNGAVYGGECGASNAVYQLYDNKVAGDFDFALCNLSLKSSQTALYFGAAGSTVNITLKGINTIDVSDAASTSQRGISSSSTKGNYLTGVGDNAKLIIKGDPDAQTEAIKGNWVIENANVTVTGTTGAAYNLVETVTPSTGGAPAGITLRRHAIFSLNGATVDLSDFTGSNGYIDVNIGAAEAGKSKITVTAYPNAGYSLQKLYVNGSYINVDTNLTMPNAGETLIIQPLFFMN